MRFEIEVNTISPMGLLEKLTLFSIGMTVGMGPHKKKLLVCMCFSPSPTTFPVTGELCSNPFVPIIFLFLSFIYFTCQIKHPYELKII